MSDSESLAEQVFKMIQAVRSGEIDSLEFRLTDSYKELQKLAASIDHRIDIDEMLNEVLSAKVNRVQELARVLAAPDIREQNEGKINKGPCQVADSMPTSDNRSTRARVIEPIS